MLEVIPAIDIRGGKCVRLYQGDYAQETVFGEDPVAVARGWQQAGATRLHVVDLDGARSGAPAHVELLVRLLAEIQLPVQIGGGIRTVESARMLLEAGAARVVLGTVAVGDPGALRTFVNACGAERLVVALDARDGRIATDGWLRQSDVSVLELAAQLDQAGIRRVLYTDIARDGTLEGPNVAAVERLAAEGGMAVIASGGVSTTEHLAALRRAGAEAAIVGRALYTGALRLHDAQRAAEGAVT